MTDGDLNTKAERSSLIERRVQRIANARSVTIGLAATFVVLAVVGAAAMRIADSDNFPNMGLAVWWALQTVTTVGYGDVVPNSTVGRLTAAVVMLTGLSLLAVTTGAVTNAFVQAAHRRRGHGGDDRVLAELAALRAELAELRTSMVTTTPPLHPSAEPGPPGTGGNA